MLQAVTLIIIAGLVVLDQVFKVMAQNRLMPIGTYGLIEKVLQLNYVENTGAAFGSFDKSTFVLIVFTSLLLLGGAYFLFFKKPNSKILYVSLVMLLSGGVGNLIDRIFRGYVIDYIDPLFVKFAVFNFADMLVTVGAFILAIYLIVDIAKNTKNNAEEKTNG